MEARLRLLINWLVSATQNFANISGHYTHQSTYIKSLNGWSYRTTLKLK